MTFIFRILDCFVFVLMVLVLLVALPFLYSKIRNKPVYVDPAFESYLALFQKDAKKHNVNLDLYKMVTVFGFMPNDGTAGYCIPNTKTIVISKKTWESIDESTKKALLYHEWGHCILRREHSEEINHFNLCPESIMYPYIDPMRRCYKLYENWYNEELFTNPHNYNTFSRRKK